MIFVQRGVEPSELASIRTSKLAKLRALAATGRLTSNDISGYELAGEPLWRAQHYKCCYCEQKLSKAYHDVEHFRPKARSDRSPGCHEIHGYWWLAYTWQNLLFACSTCNRSAKKDQFPLAEGCVSLKPEEIPPEKERPLLLDPSGSINPVEHIQFRPHPLHGGQGTIQWRAISRNGSELGDWTIRVCDLNVSEKLDLRTDHVNTTVQPQVKALNQALDARDPVGIQGVRTSSGVTPTATCLRSAEL